MSDYPLDPDTGEFVTREEADWAEEVESATTDIISDVALVLQRSLQDRLISQRQVDYLARRFVEQFVDCNYTFDRESFVLVATGSEA